MRTTATYTTKVLTLENLSNYEVVLGFMADIYSSKYESKLDLRNLDLRQYVKHGRVVLVIDEVAQLIMGVYLAQVYRASLDPTKRICYQDLMWARSPRAFKMLMDDFLTFGRLSADHIISMVGPTANLSEKSMRKLGFTPVETLYRIEV